jgi:hypothetical protein
MVNILMGNYAVCRNANVLSWEQGRRNRIKITTVMSELVVWASEAS